MAVELLKGCVEVEPVLAHVVVVQPPIEHDDIGSLQRSSHVHMLRRGATCWRACLLTTRCVLACSLLTGYLLTCSLAHLRTTFY